MWVYMYIFIYTCIPIRAYICMHVSCFQSKSVWLQSSAKVTVFGTWQSTYTHLFLTEIKSKLYLVSNSSLRLSQKCFAILCSFLSYPLTCPCLQTHTFLPAPSGCNYSVFSLFLCLFEDQQSTFVTNLLITLLNAVLIDIVSYLREPKMDSWMKPSE